MLGLLGLRIFEVTGADIADLGEKHGHPDDQTNTTGCAGAGDGAEHWRQGGRH